MATYDLEEQEQIDALKHFWRDYGRLIIAAVLAFVLGIGGGQAGAGIIVRAGARGADGHRQHRRRL